MIYKSMMRFFFLLCLFSKFSSTAAEVPVKRFNLCLNNSFAFSSYADILSSCMEVWTAIDLLKAIRTSEIERTDFLNDMLDDFLIVYCKIKTGITQSSSFQEQDIAYLIDICNYILSGLQEAFQAIDHDNLTCSKIVIARIISYLQSLELKEQTNIDS